MTPLDTLGIPRVALTCRPAALIVRSHQPLEVLSAVVVGGGFGRVRDLLNRHIHRRHGSGVYRTRELPALRRASDVSRLAHWPLCAYCARRRAGARVKGLTALRRRSRAKEDTPTCSTAD